MSFVIRFILLIIGANCFMWSTIYAFQGDERFFSRFATGIILLGLYEICRLLGELEK